MRRRVAPCERVADRRFDHEIEIVPQGVEVHHRQGGHGERSEAEVVKDALREEKVVEANAKQFKTDFWDDLLVK